MTELLGFAILPDAATADKAKEFYRMLDKIAFTCYDLEKCVPHITLYQGKFREKNLEPAKESFREIAGRWHSLDIKMGGLGTFAEEYVFWDCEKNSTLQGIHEATVRNVAGMRDRSDSIAHSQGIFLSEAMLANIARYGYPLAMSHYRPHITITRLSGCDAKNALKKADMEARPEFEATELAILSLGPNGEGKEMLEKITLKPRKAEEHKSGCSCGYSGM